MRGSASIFALLIMASMTVTANAQNPQVCTHLVKQVSFENPTGLTAEQLTKLRTVVIDQCYEQGRITGYVYDQLQYWGYSKATVYDANNFVIMDSTIHPTPIAVAIDFRLSGSDVHPK